MSVNLIKIAVGIESLQHLAEVQKSRKRGGPKAVYHFTRFMPKRVDEVLDGGSMYWIVKGMIAVRQRIVGLEMVQLDGEEEQRCGIRMDRTLVPVIPTPRRPHQGWRYLEPADAPADLPKSGGRNALPPELAAELRALGLL